MRTGYRGVYVYLIFNLFRRRLNQVTVAVVHRRSQGLSLDPVPVRSPHPGEDGGVNLVLTSKMRIQIYPTIDESDQSVSIKF